MLSNKHRTKSGNRKIHERISENYFINQICTFIVDVIVIIGYIKVLSKISIFIDFANVQKYTSVTRKGLHFPLSSFGDVHNKRNGYC